MIKKQVNVVDILDALVLSYPHLLVCLIIVISSVVAAAIVAFLIYAIPRLP
jgi:hypothetical protein